eukprot:TRINITY_DN12613_c0_g1_i1.p1 TRINITY_DN12613_c0_g1~~TRINITY_DN12613_c0_g1_i1.p1  ORF type:complete len:285 (-),score=67.92 TRINITY_DN12613_c0_g1_i1:95-949(-)
MMMQQQTPSCHHVSTKAKYTSEQHDELAKAALRDGYVILRDHFSRETLESVWKPAFLPLLEHHIAKRGLEGARGPARYYVTLPFVPPFADPAIFEDEDILQIVERLVAKDFVMCQLAIDTPCRGSDTQEVHRDTPSLFEEMDHETPMFQLAVNFPLVDVTIDPWNGPLEITKGTHMLKKEAALEKLNSGEAQLEAIAMKVGDVMIRDVRGLHRGTENKTDIPRPMCVIGYSRKWLHRPEVDVQIPKNVFDTLSARAKHMLRFERIVAPQTEVKPVEEIYESFAF